MFSKLTVIQVTKRFSLWKVTSLTGKADCFVVDITLLETKQSGLGNYFKYLIRFVAPKYEVKVDRRNWDEIRSEWCSVGVETKKVFNRLDEAEDYRKKTETEGTLVEIIRHSPLDLPL